MNVTALVDESDGAVVGRTMYDPYGKVSVRPAGDAAFVARLEALSGRWLTPRPGGRPRKRPPP